MKKIEILGVGCPRCKTTEKEIRRAGEGLGLVEGKDFSLEKVTNPVDIASRGVLNTPGVAVDGKVVSTGKIPKSQEIEKWLKCD